MANRQNNKGSAYERELAAFFSETLDLPVFRSRLSTRFEGGGNSDLHGLPALAVEAKRVERLDFRRAYRQAATNASSGEIPCVVTRTSRTPTGQSLVVLSLEDFMQLYSDFLRAKGYIS